MPALRVLLLVAALAWTEPLLAQEPPASSPDDGPLPARPAARRLALDLDVFSQDDRGANPLVAEGFRYRAVGLEFRIPASVRVIEGAATFAQLRNDAQPPMPPTVGNANVTSASTAFVTLDASLRLEAPARPDGWVMVPGLYYHHQCGYVSGGVDLDARRTLADGDSAVRLTYSGRYAWLKRRNWDRAPKDEDSRVTTNLVVAFTQTLSPSAIAAVTVHYARQRGLLHNTLDFVGMESNGAPVLLVDAALPRERNRLQLNLRGRWSPRIGQSLGLDLSGYRDDWGVREVAAEPSLESPLLLGVRGRFWYRLAAQSASHYHVESPVEERTYMTQDGNLGAFVLHSAGVLLLFPLPRTGEVGWLLRTHAMGFRRSDGLDALGAGAGVEAQW